MLSTLAAFHEPVIPFEDVPGKEGTPAPAQIVIEVPNEKVGVIRGFTVMVRVMETPHWPAAGVKV